MYANITQLIFNIFGIYAPADVHLFPYLFSLQDVQDLLTVYLFIYGCTLVYVNNFYNYATIFFVYIAVGANPKLKKVAPWIYIANVAIAFKLKNLDIIAFCIHCVYTIMFGIKINYVFIPHKPEVLNLTEDEKIILSELAKGKLQKQIEGYHQNTVTKYLRNAMERNMCKTKNELLQKYMASLQQNESQDKSQDQDD